jgi:type III pantothenate kinase
MHTLCIDIGNTQTKVAVMDAEHNILQFKTYEKVKFQHLKKIIQTYRLKNAILSTVGEHRPRLLERLSKILDTFILLSPETPIPIENAYLSPETLGKDRLAAAIGGWALFPNRNVLVVDAGTCIKYDFVRADAVYLGGSISPGLRMRYRALYEFTARLPHLDPSPTPLELVGKNTRSAMQTGVEHGILYEIEGFISAYRQTYAGDFQLILTGGDAKFLENRLQTHIFASPNLVLIGLNQILRHNL